MFCTKCGNRLNDGDSFCSNCGTKTIAECAPKTTTPSVGTATTQKSDLKKGLKLPPKRAIKMPSKAVLGQAMKQSAINREMVIQAGNLGQSIGASSAAGDFIVEGLFDGGLGGCLVVPFVLLNPMFWFQWYYRSKAKKALNAGNIEEAERMKETSTRFAIAGWVLIGIVFFALYIAYFT